MPSIPATTTPQQRIAASPPSLLQLCTGYLFLDTLYHNNKKDNIYDIEKTNPNIIGPSFLENFHNYPHYQQQIHTLSIPTDLKDKIWSYIRRNITVIQNYQSNSNNDIRNENDPTPPTDATSYPTMDNYRGDVALLAVMLRFEILSSDITQLDFSGFNFPTKQKKNNNSNNNNNYRRGNIVNNYTLLQVSIYCKNLKHLDLSGCNNSDLDAGNEYEGEGEEQELKRREEKKGDTILSTRGFMYLSRIGKQTRSTFVSSS